MLLVENVECQGHHVVAELSEQDLAIGIVHVFWLFRADS